MKQFRLPVLMLLLPLFVVPVWYMLNTDTVGTWLFGEKLNYCNVLACAVTRDRFMFIAVPSLVSFVAGLLLVIVRSAKTDRDATT